MKRKIYVFGSNREGRHGKGCALTARLEHGAVYGMESGLQGNAYAIVTKELRAHKPSVTLDEVKQGVKTFLSFAQERQDLVFVVTEIGCGLAGFTPQQIAPLFKGYPLNVVIPHTFYEIINHCEPLEE